MGKRTPTVLQKKVPAQICEGGLDTVFAACGNSVKVFSLRTGLHIKTLRSATAFASADVHRSDIVQMCISNQNADKEKRLLTICAKGLVAEWDAKTHHLLSTQQL